MDIHERWIAVWTALGLRVPPAPTIDQMLTNYSDPGRFYHTVKHLEECFSYFDRSWHLAEFPAEVELALWFHDAIYDTHNKDSEERSAYWAEDVLRESGAKPEVVTRVRELVLATKHDAKPMGADACLLVDIDLSILGAPTERFDEYEAQVRQEYHWVPEVQFRDGRQKILRALLARGNIYSTELFRSWLEANAKSNLKRSLTHFFCLATAV
jgi:predicted metal-dependent HD superfamily phosphohydrolase